MIISSGGQKIIKSLILLGLVLLFGTMGYMILEDWQLLDALYMTVITITTVGYGEINTLHEHGRLFSILLIFSGVGIMAYTIGMIAQTMVEMQIRSILGRRKLGLKIKSIKNHYIICGYGRIGEIVSQELKLKQIPLLVIEKNPDIKEELEANDIAYIIDDATDEDVLIEAGIERAKGLVSLATSDADNLFITMTARGLNPDLFILVRADGKSTHKKLLRAGANRVVLPYLIGGHKMAQTITKPAMTDFLEFTTNNKAMDLTMEELFVEARSSLNGLNLIDSKIRQKMNVIIVAISKKNGEMAFNPSSQTRIETGDTLIALGHSNDLHQLGTLLKGDG